MIRFILKFLVLSSIAITLLGILYKSQYLFNYQNLSKDKIFSLVILMFILLNLLINIVRSGKFLSASKSVFIWLSLALIIIIFYSFRFDLKYATIKVMANIFPSYGFNYKLNQIIISRSQDGHFYINANINNVIIEFMIDTGASEISLTKADAMRLNYDYSTLKFSKVFSTANGLTYGAPILIDNISIGNKVFHNINAHINSGQNDISLMGMSLLAKFSSFRIDKNILILEY